MPQVLEKRTYDQRLFDVDCSDLLDPGEQIVQDSTMAPVCDREVGLEFGAITVNTAPIFYPLTGRTVQPGQALQLLISYGYLYNQVQQLVTLRFRFATNLSPQLEATVMLRITDTPT